MASKLCTAELASLVPIRSLGVRCTLECGSVHCRSAEWGQNTSCFELDVARHSKAQRGRTRQRVGSADTTDSCSLRPRRRLQSRCLALHIYALSTDLKSHSGHCSQSHLPRVSAAQCCVRRTLGGADVAATAAGGACRARGRCCAPIALARFDRAAVVEIRLGRQKRVI